MLTSSVLISIAVLIQLAQGAIRDEVKALAGKEVLLPCAINKAICGDFHSIKWYKENRRVFVYSPVASFSKAEGELLERGQLDLDDNISHLKISPLQTTDEGEYKCEITFLDISKNCPVVQLVKLTTLAEPKYINVTLSDGRGGGETVSNNVVGPFNEGTEVVLVCESGGGKPIPQVSWYNGEQPLAGKASSFEDADRTGTGRSEVRLTVGRNDLSARLECRSTNEAVADPLSATVQLDVNLRPFATEITGAETPVEEGSAVSLLCRTNGSRPAAVLTWYNGSNPFSVQPTGQVALQDDDTYETQSRLSFIATRFEHNEKIFCEANNEVLEFYEEEPQRAEARLEVLYPPVVDIPETNITTNATSEVIIQCKYESNPTQLTQVRWYRNGDYLDVSDKSRFDGATLDQPSLVIKSAGEPDIGSYSCVLENQVGTGEAENIAHLDVYFKPEVTLRMEPQSPISELDRRNVTLFCDVLSGNPSTLTGVRWYMDGDLLKELPQCDYTAEDEDDYLCDVDPDKLLLEHVSRLFHGNFSCVGINEAGWSQMSPGLELEVLYPPGNATISKDTDVVVKGESITLTCDVPDMGRPSAEEFVWTRGGHVVNHVTSFNWTISPVTLEMEANISCVAVNAVSQGVEDSIAIEVFAPPTFIARLPPYTGSIADADNVSLICQVESSPTREIQWFKDGIPIRGNTDQFTIHSLENPPNYSTNDFESVTSTLIWNLENWPSGRLDRNRDNSNYSCQSLSNEVGGGVSSTTYFRVEYQPENLYISDERVDVVENELPEKVLCTAEAYPKASFMWRYNDEVIQTHNLLHFGSPITREQAGEYVCEAQNRHGTTQIATVLNVLYKPECTIRQSKGDDEILLTCEADANPDTVSFFWKKGNASFSGPVSDEGLHSTAHIELLQESFGTYYCYVNNTIGQGIPCEIDIQGIGILKSVTDFDIIIIVAVCAAVLVALLILVAIIIIICRKKRTNDKYANKSSPDSGHPDDLLPPTADKAFYENLPFHGLKKPPPQVLLAGLDNMDYADAELKNGPTKGQSQNNANQSEKEKKTTGGSRRI